MKKILLLCLVAFLVLSLPISGFAISHESVKAKQRTYEVSLDGIENMVEKNSRHIKQEEEKLKRLKSEKVIVDKKLQRAFKDDNVGVWMSAGEYQRMSEELDFNIKLGEISKFPNFKKHVLQAKQEYIKCLIIENEIKAIESKIQNMNNSKNIAYGKYQNGIISYREYKEQIGRHENYESEFRSAKFKLSKQKEILKRTIGLDKDAILNIRSMKAPEIKDIVKIDLEKDVKTAYENSTNLKIIEEKIIRAKKTYPINDYYIIDLEKSKQILAENLYNELSDIKFNIEIIEQRLDSGKDEQKYSAEDIDIAKKKYERGLLSKSKYEEILLNGKSVLFDNNEQIKLEILEKMLYYNDIKQGYLGGDVSDGI